MRRALWIAEDLMRDGLSWGLALGTIALSILLPAQAGWCEASLLSLPWPWSALPLRSSLAWTGAGPLLPAILLPYLLFTRRLERRLEPLLVSPARSAEIVSGTILPGVAAALAMAPLAHLAGCGGYLLKAGRLPVNPIEAFPRNAAALAVAAVLLAASAAHGALAARTPAAAMGALLPGLAVLILADAAAIGSEATGLGSLPPRALLLAAAAAAAGTAILRFDRARALDGLR